MDQIPQSLEVVLPLFIALCDAAIDILIDFGCSQMYLAITTFQQALGPRCTCGHHICTSDIRSTVNLPSPQGRHMTFSGIHLGKVFLLLPIVILLTVDMEYNHIQWELPIVGSLERKERYHASTWFANDRGAFRIIRYLPLNVDISLISSEVCLTSFLGHQAYNGEYSRQNSVRA